MNNTPWLFVILALTIQSGQSALFLSGNTFYCHDLPFSTTYKIQRGGYDLTFQCKAIAVAYGKVTPKNCVLIGIQIKRLKRLKISQIIRL